MKASVFGLGYVGVVMAACLARDGHEVIGVDVNEDKVTSVANGRSPILERGLQELLSAGVAEGRLTATTDGARAVRETEVSIVSVGTPSCPDGSPDLRYVFGVCDEIGVAARDKGGEHTIVVRSTVPPGTLAACEARLAKVGASEVQLAFNPEFLREGSAIRDFDAPAFTLAGTRSEVAREQLCALYQHLDAPFLVVEPEVAELVKYGANSWHATKIAFANEIGRVAKAYEVDGRAVMDLIMRDTKLNASAAYTKPGFAFGGSCLPKDLRALQGIARARHVTVPLLDAVTSSNDSMIAQAYREISEGRWRRVAVLGLAFKPGTDDLRESPSVTLVKRLIGEGYEVVIYDEAIRPGRLLGSNLAYIRAHLPHFEALLVPSLDEALTRSDVAVVAHASEALRASLLAADGDLAILDAAGLFEEPPPGRSYSGLGW